MQDTRETAPAVHPTRFGRMLPLLSLLMLPVLLLAAWFGWQQLRQDAAKPDLTGPISARSLNGTWAWFGIENCRDFYLTISFAGDRIYVRQDGIATLDIRNAKIEKMDIDIAPTVAVTYELGGNDYESQYRFDSINEIVLIDDLVNGKHNPAIDKSRGRRLVRCAKTDPMPELGQFAEAN